MSDGCAGGGAGLAHAPTRREDVRRAHAGDEIADDFGGTASGARKTAARGILGLPGRLAAQDQGVSADIGNLSATWRILTDPVVATLVHGTAIWIWHVPLLFNAALGNPVMHGFQHVCFFGSALLFWWALLQGRTRKRAYGVAAFYLFVTALHSGFLRNTPFDSKRADLPRAIGRRGRMGPVPLEDQQMAGLIMWVPAGMAYAAATLVMLGSGLRDRVPCPHPGGVMPLRFARLTIFTVGVAARVIGRRRDARSGTRC